MNQVYDTVRLTLLYGAAIAALIAGYRIFHKFNRGQDVENDLWIWFGGMIVVVIAAQLINDWIYTPGGGAMGNDGSGFSSKARGLAVELVYVIQVLGFLVGLVGCLQLYAKWQNGEDNLSGLALRWLGSMMFLFLISVIVSAIM
jgi:hypothetical protein